ncbi:M81 family metallopeptidase [Aliamphritea hakodatensis]|uniref:M81 family metallopeptidase n=1 Tax=Aliamphritea hakodatensis TaxID=2895352 RepID=UPI0022FD9E00|nr:M81 family metallopeptidase [Aliamphritea hakodatensis]
MSKRIAVIEFINESNTFTVLPTRLDDFQAGHYLTGDAIPAALKDTNTEVGGFIDAAKKHGWSPVYTVAAHAEPGGIVCEAARQKITSDTLKLLREAGTLDGVFIALHGAMVTETHQDGETQFLQEVRQVVGEETPVAITLDLHANIFDEMVGLADIAVTYRTYPHVDMYDRATEACELLQRTLNGDIRPAITLARPPMLVGCDDGRTTQNGPMCRLLENAECATQRHGILNVAVNAGFTDADVYAAGPSVLVTYDTLLSTAVIAQEIAEGICDEIWQYRHEWDLPQPLEDCITQAQQYSGASRPVIIADFSDNPGSGAYSDCTALLSALLKSGLPDVAIGAIYDPAAVKTLMAAKPGEEVTLEIGGKTDPAVGGGPLQLTGKVTAKSNGRFTFEGPMFTGLENTTGDSVCFRSGNASIMLVSERTQMLDKNIFRSVGIEPTEKNIVAVKSMQHFRAAFEPIAAHVLVTDAGGLCSPDVNNRQYTNLRRPVFPLDNLS